MKTPGDDPKRYPSWIPALLVAGWLALVAMWFWLVALPAT